MRTDKLSDFVSVLSNVVHSDEMFDILFDLTGSELYIYFQNNSKT